MIEGHEKSLLVCMILCRDEHEAADLVEKHCRERGPLSQECVAEVRRVLEKMHREYPL